jgi:hypothetical protein
MNELEQHDNMIRKSERILLLKTISNVFYSLDSIEQMRIYINHRLDDESNKDKKVFNK